MADSTKPLLIKRYASRRLYNTETSDYVTLDDIAEFIREGREVQIIDLKSGDDLTRQYLLQIIAEHESRGENVLPINVLTDLVRSYSSTATSMVPDFLAASFEMLQQGQSKMMENMTKANPLVSMPGMDAMRAQQEAFLKAMTGGMAPDITAPDNTTPDDTAPDSAATAPDTAEDGLSDIKKQLADLQDKLSKLGN
ncbi:MAG: polyhydroxyalkanoate synthesis repressor PhaR [Roseovarius sp.]|nr:polyhydroxyalkanoate synthesis repressor PhaR [Roseovarius sp.]